MTGLGLSVVTISLNSFPTMALYPYSAIPYPPVAVARPPLMSLRFNSSDMTFLFLSMSAVFYAMSDPMSHCRCSVGTVGVSAIPPNTVTLLFAVLCVALTMPAMPALPPLTIVATVVAHTVCYTAVAQCTSSRPR